MWNTLKTDWLSRPWWMNLVWYFCLYMTFIYMPFDMFTKPFEEWEEVWFGFVFTGWAAKLTEPLHWLIYGAGAYGFWRMKSWMWPWAAVYCAQVTIAMLLWGYIAGRGLTPAASVGGPMFLALTIALWRAKNRFGDQKEPAQENAAEAHT